MIDHQNHSWQFDFGPLIFWRVSDLLHGYRHEALLILIKPPLMRGLQICWKPIIQIKLLGPNSTFNPSSRFRQ